MAISAVQLNREGGFIVTLDSGSVLYVPDDNANRHKQEVDAWIALGNAPTPADPRPPVDKTSTLSNEEIEELIRADTFGVAAVDAKKAGR